MLIQINENGEVEVESDEGENLSLEQIADINAQVEELTKSPGFMEAARSGFKIGFSISRNVPVEPKPDKPPLNPSQSLYESQISEGDIQRIEKAEAGLMGIATGVLVREFDRCFPDTLPDGTTVREIIELSLNSPGELACIGDFVNRIFTVVHNAEYARKVLSDESKRLARLRKKYDQDSDVARGASKITLARNWLNAERQEMNKKIKAVHDKFRWQPVTPEAVAEFEPGTYGFIDGDGNNFYGILQSYGYEREKRFFLFGSNNHGGAVQMYDVEEWEIVQTFVKWRKVHRWIDPAIEKERKWQEQKEMITSAYMERPKDYAPAWNKTTPDGGMPVPPEVEAVPFDENITLDKIATKGRSDPTVICFGIDIRVPEPVFIDGAPHGAADRWEKRKAELIHSAYCECVSRGEKYANDNNLILASAEKIVSESPGCITVIVSCGYESKLGDKLNHVQQDKNQRA